MKDAFDQNGGKYIPEYIIQLSKNYDDCEHVLNKLGAVTYKSQCIEGLIGYWSKLDLDYLSKRDFIKEIEIATTGSF